MAEYKENVSTLDNETTEEFNSYDGFTDVLKSVGLEFGKNGLPVLEKPKEDLYVEKSDIPWGAGYQIFWNHPSKSDSQNRDSGSSYTCIAVRSEMNGPVNDPDSKLKETRIEFSINRGEYLFTTNRVELFEKSQLEKLVVTTDGKGEREFSFGNMHISEKELNKRSEIKENLHSKLDSFQEHLNYLLKN